MGPQIQRRPRARWSSRGAPQETLELFSRQFMTASRARGNALSIQGLSKSENLRFKRAAMLDGAPSISAWLSRAIRRVIRDQEAKHGDLLNALTQDERDILEVIESGANDPEHISAEVMISQKRLDPILADLLARGLIETRRQGGKTEAARGARRNLYFVTEKYQSG